MHYSAHLKHYVLVVFVKHVGGEFGLRGEFRFLGFLSHLVPEVLGFLLLRCALGQGVLLRLTRGSLAALRAVGLASAQGRWGEESLEVSFVNRVEMPGYWVGGIRNIVLDSTSRIVVCAVSCVWIPLKNLW